jgi:predicted dehydrogenase
VSASVAVVGVGRMGRRHLQALNSLDASVVAVADRDAASLAQALTLAPDARAYDDWHDLLQKERVDLLCIATTSPSHAPIVFAAAAARVPRILCEKPLATSLEAGRQMIAVCRNAGVKLAINHSRRRFEPYLQIEAALAADLFGDVRMMRTTCGGVGLANIGTHAFDLMRWFCGPALAVTGYVDREPQPNPRGSQFHDPGGHGLIAFAHGRRGTFDFTGDFSSGLIVEFGCRYGRIVVREQLREIEAAARPREARMAPLPDYGMAYEPVTIRFEAPVNIVAMTAAMIRDALEEGGPACTGEDALAVLEMAAAVHVSDAEHHAAVRLPLSDDRGSLERIA